MQNSKIFKEFIGIDVSKDKLDTYNSRTGELIQVVNSVEAIEAFISTVTFSDDLLVVIDLTGGYEAACVNAFCDAGFHVHRAEGRRVKPFMKAMNQKAKTDNIDAFGLAKYGEKMQENLMLYTPPRKSIKQQAERLSDLKKMLQAEKNRYQAPAQSASILMDIKEHIEFLERKISAIEAEIRQIVADDELMSKLYEVITSFKGVGDKTAMTLLAFLPELGTVNRRKVAALAGLAPFAKDSGKMTGYRTTKGKGGRPQLKNMLFLCAMTAVKWDVKMKAFYQKLCAKGKKAKVALTAVMRKMLIAINAEVKKVVQLG